MAYQGLKKSGNGANKLGVNYMGRASGSTPQRVGAKMLVFADGRIIGN